MKRYRVLVMDFDTRATILAMAESRKLSEGASHSPSEPTRQVLLTGIIDNQLECWNSPRTHARASVASPSDT